jgi:hypothetical protein
VLLLELTQAAQLGTWAREITAFTAGVHDETAVAIEGAHEIAVFVAGVRSQQ